MAILNTYVKLPEGMTNDTTRICLIFRWHMFNGENGDKLWEFVVTFFKTTMIANIQIRFLQFCDLPISNGCLYSDISYNFLQFCVCSMSNILWSANIHASLLQRNLFPWIYNSQ